MKRILTILLILFLFLSSFLIYKKTEKKNNYLLFIGDRLIKDNFYYKAGNTCFVNEDYRVIDLINILKYNEELVCNGRKTSLHYLLNKADIVVISIGINDIYSNYYDDSKLFYYELSETINNINILLSYINKYDYKDVILLDYFNKFDNNEDFVLYLDYNIRKIISKYGFKYEKIDDFISNYSVKTNNLFILN